MCLQKVIGGNLSVLTLFTDVLLDLMLTLFDRADDFRVQLWVRIVKGG